MDDELHRTTEKCTIQVFHFMSINNFTVNMTQNFRCGEVITIPEAIENSEMAFAYQKNSSLRLLFDHQVIMEIMKLTKF